MNTMSILNHPSLLSAFINTHAVIKKQLLDDFKNPFGVVNLFFWVVYAAVFRCWLISYSAIWQNIFSRSREKV